MAITMLKVGLEQDQLLDRVIFVRRSRFIKSDKSDKSGQAGKAGKAQAEPTAKTLLYHAGKLPALCGRVSAIDSIFAIIGWPIICYCMEGIAWRGMDTTQLDRSGSWGMVDELSALQCAIAVTVPE